MIRVKVFKSSDPKLGWVAIHFECGEGSYLAHYEDDEINRMGAIDWANEHFRQCYNTADIGTVTLNEFLEDAYDRQLARDLRGPRNRLHLGRRRRA